MLCNGCYLLSRYPKWSSIILCFERLGGLVNPIESVLNSKYNMFRMKFKDKVL